MDQSFGLPEVKFYECPTCRQPISAVRDLARAFTYYTHHDQHFTVSDQDFMMHGGIIDLSSTFMRWLESCHGLSVRWQALRYHNHGLYEPTRKAVSEDGGYAIVNQDFVLGEGWRWET
jgi:hypothetical protein